MDPHAHNGPRPPIVHHQSISGWEGSANHPVEPSSAPSHDLKPHIPASSGITVSVDSVHLGARDSRSSSSSGGGNRLSVSGLDVPRKGPLPKSPYRGEIRQSKTPSRYEMKEPENYYPMAIVKHSFGTMQIFLNKTYYIPGEQIVGYICVTITQPIDTLGASVTCYGEEKAKTFQEQTVYREEKPFPYHINHKTQKVEYFHGKVVLQGAGTLAAGEHVFHFPPVDIPSSMPPSFYNEIGKKKSDQSSVYTNIFGLAGVRCILKAHLKIHGQDIKVRENVRICDKKTFTTFLQTDTKVKTFMMTRGELKVTCELDKIAFLANEPLHFRVKVSNETSKEIRCIKAKLMRVEQLHTDMNNCQNKIEVHHQQFEGCGGHKDTTIHCDMFVPKEALLPTVKGKLCNCEYVLDVEADIAMSKDVMFEFPIIITHPRLPEDPLSLNPRHNKSWHKW